MKSFFVLAFVAVVCAAAKLDQVEQPRDKSILLSEPVKFMDLPELESDNDLRVQIVDFADPAQPDLPADENANLFENFNGESYAFAPSELESVRVDLPEGFDPLYPYESVDDAMLR